MKNNLPLKFRKFDNFCDDFSLSVKKILKMDINLPNVFDNSEFVAAYFNCNKAFGVVIFLVDEILFITKSSKTISVPLLDIISFDNVVFDKETIDSRDLKSNANAIEFLVEDDKYKIPFDGVRGNIKDSFEINNLLRILIKRIKKRGSLNIKKSKGSDSIDRDD